ncbi:MAG: patatin-like phospholipase family protein, partial [Holophagae bacterium]
MKWKGSSRRALMRLRSPVLALGGGGARGFVHIGVLRVIESAGVGVRAVVGTSMGSVMGAMYLVHGSAEAVEASWREAIREEIVPVVHQVRTARRATQREHPLIQAARRFKNRVEVSIALNRSTVLDGAVLDRAVDFLLPDIDIEDLPKPFTAVATHLETGAEVRLERGSLRSAVKASSSIPGMVPAVEIDGAQLVDGGVVAEVPIAAAKRFGSPVLAVDASMEIPSLSDDDLALDTMMRTQMMTSERLRQRQIAEVRWVIRPDIGPVAWADWDVMDEMIASGDRAARDFF